MFKYIYHFTIVTLTTLSIIAITICITYLFAISKPEVDVSRHLEVSITPSATNYYPFLNTQYRSEYIEINNDTIYISYPQSLLENHLKADKLTVYSHGEDQFIGNPLSETMSPKINQYSQYYSSQGSIFIAPNLFGNNWGDRESIDNLSQIINQILQTETGIVEIEFIGYSMGALAVINNLRFNQDLLPPELTISLILIAPTPDNERWGAQYFSTLSNIDINVWHGAADKNIVLSWSEKLTVEAAKHNVNINLNIIEKIDHNSIENHLLTNNLL